MSVHGIYRACVWLPIAVPAMLIAVAKGFGIPLAEGIVTEVLAYSLLYGGIPYAVLAIGATAWIGGRPEPQIRRLMFRAPLLMVALFVPLSLGIGWWVGAPGPFATVAGLGAIIIIPLGYTYVGLTVLLRGQFGPVPTASPGT